MKVKDLITELQAMDPSESVATLLWTRPDIHQKYREILELDEDAPDPLTDEQCDEILDHIDVKKDASFGISWDTLHYAVDDYLDNHPAAQSGRVEMKGKMTVYPTFSKFYIAEVLPRRIASPDSRTLGDNTRQFGYFRFHGMVWVVYSHTWFLPLDSAHFFGAEHSFIEELPSGRRKRISLSLDEGARQGMEASLRRMGENPRLKCLYVYESKE